MLVCHCQRVTDRQVRRAVREGAASVQGIARACAAGAGCGGCHGALEDILCEERAASGSVLLSLSDVVRAG